jgi:hypothetical protein
MWLAASTLLAAGFMLWPFAAFAPSGRNLTALLPELHGLLATLYRHCWDEYLYLLSVVRRRRRRRRVS